MATSPPWSGGELVISLSAWCALAFLVFAGLAGWRGEAAAATYTLTWADRSDDEDGFLIERRRDVQEPFVGIATVGADVTTFVDAGLADGVPYCYRVRAFSGVGLSAPSNEACAPLDESSWSAPLPAPFPERLPAPFPAPVAAPLPFPLSVALIISPVVVRPGAVVEFSVVAANLGPALPVDVHFGVVLPSQWGAVLDCPGGPSDTMLVFEAGFARTELACLSTTFARGAPLVPAVPIPGGLVETGFRRVLGFLWPGDLPLGIYTFVLGVAAAGSGPPASGWPSSARP